MSSSLVEKWKTSGLLDDAENVESLAESLEAAYQYIFYLSDIGVNLDDATHGIALPAIRRIHDETESSVSGEDVVETLQKSMIYLKKETIGTESVMMREAEITDIFVEMYLDQLEE